MTTAYSSLLGLALPVQGELAGQWGDTVNDYITKYLDASIAGSLSITADVTLTKTTGTTLGATSSQYAILTCSPSSVNIVVTAPAAYKIYVVNNTSASYTVTIRGATPTSGVVLAALEKAVVAWNGSDFFKVATSATDGVSTFSAGSTGLTPSSATAGAVTLAGTLAVANGGTGLTAGTSGGVLAYTAAGTLASSSALAASALVIGGGAGAAPSTTTTGTGVVTALGVNTGSAGAFVVNGGALGSPSSAGTMPAFTLGGTVSGGGNQINNVIIGTTTPLAGAFTTLTASSTLTVTGAGSIEGLTVGRGAGAVSTNTAVGASALTANTSGAFNAALSYNALTSNTTGQSNSAAGLNSLVNNTTGSQNVAFGTSALSSNTTASNNTAVGYQAGYTNTTGASNFFGGYRAGYLSTGGDNCLVGWASGQSLTTATSCAFFGVQTGYNTTGTNNNFFGASAGFYVTSGAYNTILGGYTGNQNGLDIRTLDNRVAISDGAGNVRYYHDGSATGFLYPRIDSVPGTYYGFDTGQFYPFPDNTLKLGTASFRWTTVYATTGTINTSDATTKQQIRSLNDAEKNVAQAIKGLIKAYKFNDAVAKKGDGARIHIGAIAQEVQAAFVAEGLNPNRYAMFCSDTWYEVDGKPSETAIEPFTAETPNAVEVTRLGLRYEELLAFVISTL